jgi:hypothetical protein
MYFVNLIERMKLIEVYREVGGQSNTYGTEKASAEEKMEGSSRGEFLRGK